MPSDRLRTQGTRPPGRRPSAQAGQSVVHVPASNAEIVSKIVREKVHRESGLHTYESRLYRKVGTEFAVHETVNHGARENARGDVTTNTVEGYFGLFERACMATTSTAQKRTCTATWRNTI